MTSSFIIEASSSLSRPSSFAIRYLILAIRRLANMEIDSEVKHNKPNQKKKEVITPINLVNLPSIVSPFTRATQRLCVHAPQYNSETAESRAVEPTLKDGFFCARSGCWFGFESMAMLLCDTSRQG